MTGCAILRRLTLIKGAMGLSKRAFVEPPAWNLCPSTRNLGPTRRVEIDARFLYCHSKYFKNMHLTSNGNLFLFPVFKFEIGDSAELASIVGHKNQVSYQCLGGDQHVIGSNEHSPSLQV